MGSFHQVQVCEFDFAWFNMKISVLGYKTAGRCSLWRVFGNCLYSFVNRMSWLILIGRECCHDFAHSHAGWVCPTFYCSAQTDQLMIARVVLSIGSRDTVMSHGAQRLMRWRRGRGRRDHRTETELRCHRRFSSVTAESLIDMNASLHAFDFERQFDDRVANEWFQENWWVYAHE